MRPTTPPRLAVVGHVCVDVAVRPFTELPPAGKLVETERVDAHVGGLVGNIGRVLGPLGEPAYAVYRAGTDPWGDLIDSEVGSWADTEFATRSTTQPTSLTVVLVRPDGERAFIHAKGTNAELAAEHVPIDALADRGVTHLHIGYALLLPAMDGEPMIELLRRARSRGITTSLDITWDSTGRWSEAVFPVLPHVDIFCPNDVEATALTGEQDPARAAQALLAAGVRQLVVVTCGARGATGCAAGGEPFFVAPVRREVRDATGGGDCFNGALLTGLIRGMQPREAATSAAEIAADALAARA